MNRVELEDLVRLHNIELDEEWNALHTEWLGLREQAFSTLDSEKLRDLKWRCDALRTRMDKLISEKVELKESA